MYSYEGIRTNNSFDDSCVYLDPLGKVLYCFPYIGHFCRVGAYLTLGERGY